jgi:hypothetical protein
MWRSAILLGVAVGALVLVVLGAPWSESFAAPPRTVDGGAAADSGSVRDVRNDGPDTPPVVDSPPWPAGVKSMRLTWVIYPAVMRNDVPTRRIELVVRAGDVARRLGTQIVGTIGYAIAMQPDCQVARDGGVRSAQLFLNGGGNMTLSAQRHDAELWLSEDTSADGLCDPGPCPSTATTIGRMTVPPDVLFDERFHVVDGPSSEHDERCP